jgi:uncharacterized cupin superfamily protein
MAKVFRLAPKAVEPRPNAPADFTWHTGPRLAQLAGSKYLQADLRSLDPDRFSFPYHFHRASEEFFVALSGAATLRTPEGFRTLSAGDLAFFEEGPAGAHQLYNHGAEPFVYLDVRATPAPGGLDVTEYPDSGKVAILPLRGDVYEAASKVDYHKGEHAVRSKWPADLLRT